MPSKHIKRLLWNRQVFIFLFFLFLSTAFWLFQAMNEDYEEEFLVPIQLTGVPRNVVITTDLPQALHVTLRDKGSVLFTYRYTTRRLQPVTVDFATYASSGTGYAQVKGAELMQQVAAQLMSTTRVSSYKPETLEFYYNYGLCKRVPVVMQGSVRADRLYTLSASLCTHDSVLVYASQQALDTITAAYTQPIHLTALTDTTRQKAAIVPVRGAKFVPASVSYTFCIDRLIDKTVQVPVQQVNFPASKQLRTFPSTVSVTFQVGMGRYRSVTSENFVLVVNYEDLLKADGNRVHLSLKSIPTGVSHVRISPQDVEYIIEEISDEESEDTP